MQDVDDYPVDPGANLAYYDPDDVRGEFAADGWPSYPGLMDRAQQITLTPDGLDVPFYVTNGNHDVLVQGNEDANAAFEDIATGCFKALGTTINPAAGQPDPNTLLFPLAVGMLDPARPAAPVRRQAPDQADLRRLGRRATTTTASASSTRRENQASNGVGLLLRLEPGRDAGLSLHLDRHQLRGRASWSSRSNGNIDDPQFEWLKGELDAAPAANKYVVIFGHHPVRSLNDAGPRRGGGALHRHRRARPRPQPGLRPRPAQLRPDPPRPEPEARASSR